MERHIRTLDRLLKDLRVVEGDIARHALDDDAVQRLMTIPGIDVIVAVGLAAAIGDVARFTSAEKLVAYLGLSPSVRQSGNGPARHGRIAKQRRGQARGLLVEVAWAAVRAPGPLRTFFGRIASRRGQHVAAVAKARKIAVLAWQLLARGEDYAWVRPALQARKLRSLELRAGRPRRHGQRGAAYDYNIKEVRQRDRHAAEGAETANAKLTQGWRQSGPKKPRACTGVAKEERRSEAARRGRHLRAPLLAKRPPVRGGNLAGPAERGFSISSVVHGCRGSVSR